MVLSICVWFVGVVFRFVDDVVMLVDNIWVCVMVVVESVVFWLIVVVVRIVLVGKVMDV